MSGASWLIQRSSKDVLDSLPCRIVAAGLFLCGK